MDESALDRMAIEEIVREMNEARELELRRPLERKINPLGKPNKRFLGRTINSMLTHNKRESDRKRENCQRKLQDLDERARRRQRNEYFNGSREECHSRTKSRSASSVSISNSSSSAHESDVRIKKSKAKKKKKLKKYKQRSRSSSSSSDISEAVKTKYKASPNTAQYGEYAESANNYAADYYQQANLHYSSVAAAYNQMQQMYYSSMLASASSSLLTGALATSSTAHNPGAEKLKKCKSESSVLSLSLSLSSSCSLEEYENGVLTINVSSDNEKSSAVPQRSKCVQQTNDSDVAFIGSSSSSECSEGLACINLDSDSKHSSAASNGSVAILSCSSDSDKEKVAEKVALIVEQSNDAAKLMIDLTDD